MKNQKFSGGDTFGPPSIARASGPRIQALPEKSPHLSNQQPQLQFASYGTDFSMIIIFFLVIEKKCWDVRNFRVKGKRWFAFIWTVNFSFPSSAIFDFDKLDRSLSTVILAIFFQT